MTESVCTSQSELCCLIQHGRHPNVLQSGPVSSGSAAASPQSSKENLTAGRTAEKTSSFWLRLEFFRFVHSRLHTLKWRDNKVMSVGENLSVKFCYLLI